MTDVDRVLQVERFNEREVIGVGVHFVAVPWLARPAMPATVVGDTAVSAGGKKHHLVLPGVRAQRPAMAEDHGLSAAPVLVINIDGAGIFFTNTDVWHLKLPFLSCCFLQTDDCSGPLQRDSLPHSRLQTCDLSSASVQHTVRDRSHHRLLRGSGVSDSAPSIP